ncbi:hypothetical protein PHMEG_00024347 [Phytophthora megakarya]|uniref:Uncharacterized protein n=1 Tax=Phytophthora megakarya TaxID=4795 RepID=A0A225VEP9_9STRA|nr:hypothetical protein PHMEG_00024347 [Phytophthora megakarya]
MLTRRRGRLTSRHTNRALWQLYNYAKHGSFSKAARAHFPLCVDKEIDRLNGVVRYYLLLFNYIYGGSS